MIDPTILGGLLNGFGNMLGAGASIFNNERQIATQKESQATQNAWQSEENQKDRLWQEQQWLSQFEKQNEENDRRFQQENAEYDRRFQQSNEYNDPSAVVARLQAAGINPAAAMGQLTGSGGMAAAGGSSSPQMPNTAIPTTMGPHGVSPVGISNPNNVVNISGLLSGFADLMNARTNAGRLDLDTEYQAKTLSSVVDKMNKDATYSQSLTDLNNLQLEIDKAFKSPQAAAELKRTINHASLFALQGDTEKSQKLLNDEIKRLTNVRGDIYEGSKAGLITLVDKYANSLDASAQASRAAAAKSHAETQTINETREYDVAYSRFESELESYKRDIARSDSYVSTNTKNERVSSMVKQLEQADLITKTMAVELEKAIIDRDWQTVEKISSVVKSASESFKNFKSVGVEIQNADSRSRSTDAYERDVEDRIYDRIYRRSNSKRK